MSEDFQYKNMLYDFYGGLLTEKQRAYFENHYMEDLSLAEIAGQYGVTPQAVADLIKRVSILLENYEKTLGLLKKHNRNLTLSQNISDILSEISNPAYAERAAAIRRILEEMV